MRDEEERENEPECDRQKERESDRESERESEREKERISGQMQDRMDRAEEIYEDQGRILQGVWVAAGLLVVLAGIAMIVVPGPVTIVVPLGLAMLSVVFGWARRLLLMGVEKGVDAKNRVQDAGTAAKVMGVLAVASLVIAVVVAIGIYRWG